MNMIKAHQLAHKLHKNGFIFMAKFITKVNFIIYNSVVPASVEIGEGSKFAYGGVGLVIHARAKIGKNVTLGQGITIGGRSKRQNVPVIGDNVYIGAGARIIGDVVIGDNSIVAPNAVVIESIPNNVMVAGVPAKIKKINIEPENFI